MEKAEKEFKRKNWYYSEYDDEWFEKDGDILYPYQLSSGEKQILVILLTVLVQDNRRGVLFMDEPEVSLHVEWQQRLISLIRQLNPNVQIVLTTHSPADFLDGEPGCLILGDNLFYGQGFSAMLRRAATLEKGACIFGYYVKDPRAYGVVEFDESGKVISLEEKPAVPKSNYAVPGLYFYDATVTEKALALEPSVRGEYEITDLNKLYLGEGTLKVELFGRGFAWLDTGNCNSLLEASNFVATIQNRQGFYVSCIEEIAWRNGWISSSQLKALGEKLGKTEYGKYLIDLAN